MKRLALALTVVALVAPLVLGLHPGTASAGVIFHSASITIHPVAQLVTVPAAVTVTVTYDCPPTSPTDTAGNVAGFVEQNGTHFFGSTSATCDDKSHMTTVQVVGTFNTGPANAQFEVMNSDASATAVQEAEIMIKS